MSGTVSVKRLWLVIRWILFYPDNVITKTVGRVLKLYKTQLPTYLPTYHYQEDWLVTSLGCYHSWIRYRLQGSNPQNVIVHHIHMFWPAEPFATELGILVLVVVHQSSSLGGVWYETFGDYRVSFQSLKEWPSCIIWTAAPLQPNLVCCLYITSLILVVVQII